MMISISVHTMARRKDKAKAIELRKKGYSYSQIKQKLGIGKGTLSGWLSDMPLPTIRIRELQFNDEVIEKIRATKLKKRQARLENVYETVASHIGSLSDRELFIAGFFLYWGEGGKTKPYTTTLANTDPAMIRFYLRWLEVLKVPKEKIFVRLQLYSDMDVDTEIRYWSKAINLPKKYFRKPYIKKTKFENITFSTFGHGTCNVILDHRDTAEYVLQGLKKVSSDF